MKKDFRKIFRKVPYETLMFIGLNQDKKFLTQTLIAREIGIPITTLNYWIKQFTKFDGEGLIHSTKNIKLTDKGNKLFKYLWNNLKDSKKLRGHNIVLVYDVVCGNVCLRQLRSVAEPFTNKRYEGLKIEVLGCKAVLYSGKKIVVALKDIYTDEGEDIAGVIALLSSQIANLLEQEYKIKVNSSNYKIKKLHTAVLNSVVAESYIIKNKATFSASGIDIDKSHKKYELEATGLDSLERIGGLIKYEEMFKENQELKKELRKMKERDKNQHK